MTISLGAGWPIAAPAVVRPTRIAETRAVAARARALSAPLSYAREQWLDEVVMRPLVTAGYLAKAGRLYLPGRMPLALAACINLATPGTGDMTPTNSPTFTADAGYDLDGVSSYLNLNYTVLTDFSTTLLKQNSAHMWVRASSIINGVTTLLIGRNSGSVALDLRRSTTNVLQGYANSSSAASFGTVGTAGFFGWSRVEATKVRGFGGGALISEQSTTSAVPGASQSLSVGRAASVFSAFRVEAIGLGSGLSDAEFAALDAVLDAAWAEAPPA